ncbi:MAG: sulfatase [Candidatus Hydrogenedentes bacterium]|nr:sulfatase [Candidatus Hydrogenedentota bacterium]
MASLALPAVHAHAAEGAKQSPRNIIFILTDDQRFDGAAILGHPFVETPHLDALVKGGIVFKNAFVATALCSPSRATILTGLYAHTHGVLDNNTPLPPSAPTFPRELQKAGYETAFIGKWHMGGQSEGPQPGFDRWVSFQGQGEYEGTTLNVDGTNHPGSGYITDVLTDYAEEFLRKPRQKPFCMCLCHKAVHAMFKPAPRYKGCYADKTYPHPASMADTPENYRGKPAWVRAQRNSWHGVDGMYANQIDFDTFTRLYAETLRAVDDSVGRIVATLRELGQLDSTLIVFTSDNGFLMGEHGLIDKRCMYEPSIRVPLIVHCPELFAGGTTRDEMILNTDYAPTFLEAAGCPIPTAWQGKSFYPLLENKQIPWRDAFLYEYFWERSFPQTPTVQGIRTDRYKLMRYHGVWDRYELYDLQNDPNEMNNLLGDIELTVEGGAIDNLINDDASPEVKPVYRQLAKRLKELVEETSGVPEPIWYKSTSER